MININKKTIVFKRALVEQSCLVSFAMHKFRVVALFELIYSSTTTEPKAMYKTHCWVMIYYILSDIFVVGIVYNNMWAYRWYIDYTRFFCRVEYKVIAKVDWFWVEYKGSRATLRREPSGFSYMDSTKLLHFFGLLWATILLQW